MVTYRLNTTGNYADLAIHEETMLSGSTTSPIYHIITCLSLLIAIMFISPASGEAVPAMITDKVITIHGGDWDSIKLLNAIFSYIIREGYGYKPMIVPGSEKMVSESLSSGMVDVSLEAWKENHPPELQQEIDSGAILDLGRVYGKAAHIFIIPLQIAEQYNISSLEDMKQYWYLCRDPEDPSKGLFYNALVSWLVHDTNLIKLEVYGLSPFYNPVSMPTSRAYEAAFRKAARENRTIFGLYWYPSALMGTGYWKKLAEPVQPGCTIGTLPLTKNESTSTQTVCPYPVSDVHKLAARSLQTRAPELLPVISAFDPDEEAVSRILDLGFQRNESDWNLLAEEYLNANPQRWEPWVSPQAYTRIKMALEQHETGRGE